MTIIIDKININNCIFKSRSVFMCFCLISTFMCLFHHLFSLTVVLYRCFTAFSSGEKKQYWDVNTLNFI